MNHTHHGYGHDEQVKTVEHDHPYEGHPGLHDHPEEFLAIYHDFEPPPTLLDMIGDLERTARTIINMADGRERTSRAVSLQVKLVDMGRRVLAEAPHGPEQRRVASLMRALYERAFKVEESTDNELLTNAVNEADPAPTVP